jgi:mannose-6-phosphate isomerase-like protein (cupin superfamily)
MRRGGISAVYRPARSNDWRAARRGATIEIMTNVIDPLTLSREVNEAYRNVSLGNVNDHEIRMSVMTEQFRWHRHPDSDETFYGVDGELIIEFPDREVVVRPGQFVTVPAGTLHRTRPAGARSVNLTFERIGAQTIFEE